MPFRLEHDFVGEKYTIVADRGQLRVVGPDFSEALVHFAKIFRDCAINVTALHRCWNADGQLNLEFDFEVEDEEDLNVLLQELSAPSV